ncbi:MAG: bifunctional 3,4-dihydroxy-2-butanone-4-phosphate synthase/GTP cyclohydrolase II [Patescibacteria group bacterium]|jgi:3,4-dihydroxy 2-butanone 4-phosphate synthase/GTP cyclohydrolase II
MLNTIQSILQDIKKGKPVILVDDANRENEGDLVVAADFASAKWINLMLQTARGIVCVALPEERCRALNLPLMVVDNTDPYGTNFTVSVDAKIGIHTGVSAQDRATTIKALINPKTTPYDLVRPGHVFPLQAKPGGVLQRAGHTEAAVDLARLAGLTPAGVTCEIINADGTMARLPQLLRFAKKHKIKIASIADLIEYRRNHEQQITQLASATIPTKLGEWTVAVFGSPMDQFQQHVALIKGEIKHKNNVVVRMHSECITGDVFHSQRCDCGAQLAAAMEYINKVGSGVIVYLRQEGRGIGLVNKLLAYRLQDKGLDTVEANLKLGFAADLRDYGIGAQILKALGLSTIKLLTNNPKKVIGLNGYGLKIVQQIPLQIKANKHNKKYLHTKQKKMGHKLVI